MATAGDTTSSFSVDDVTESLTCLLIQHQYITEACCYGDHCSVPDSDLVEAERHLVITLSLSLSLSLSSSLCCSK